MEKFNRGQLVSRRGYINSNYIVIGYNGAGSVIVIPVDAKDTLSERELFLECQLREKS